MGGENTSCCICFLSVLSVVLFSLFYSVKLFSPQPMSFCLFLLLILPHIPHRGGRRSERVTVWFLCCKLRQNYNRYFILGSLMSLLLDLNHQKSCPLNLLFKNAHLHKVSFLNSILFSLISHALKNKQKT